MDKSKMKDFIPEMDPEIIKYDNDEELYLNSFLKDKNVNYKKLQISNIGRYSMSKPRSAQIISKIIKKYTHGGEITITDATANMGGNTISFGKYFNKVNAVEILDFHCKILKNNLKQFNLLEKVTVYCNNYLDVMHDLKQDVIFFDPPWGGKDYSKNKQMNLYLNNIDIVDISNEVYKKTKIILIKVPKNFNINKFTTDSKFKNIDIIKIYTSKNKLKYYLLVLTKN